MYKKEFSRGVGVDAYAKKTKHYRDVLINKAFAKLEMWEEREIENFLEKHSFPLVSPEENIRNAKILIIHQYDSMDYQTLLRTYGYSKMVRNSNEERS